jgi:hypothetical protein
MSDEQGITDTTADESVGDALGTPGAQIEEATVIEPEDVVTPLVDEPLEEVVDTPANPILTPEQALNAVRPDAQ